MSTGLEPQSKGEKALGPTQDVKGEKALGPTADEATNANDQE
jgi:hypothetical protein